MVLYRPKRANCLWFPPLPSLCRTNQVCKASFHSHLSVVSLPHGKRSRKNDAEGDHFAWLTTTEDSQRDFETNLGFDGNIYDDTGFRGLLLCLGKLDREPRGSFQKKTLLQTPTHLLYAPVTRSIVVACQDNTSGDDGRRGVGPVPPSCPSLSCSLRVFNADTLDERPGGPLHLIPGVKVTGMASLDLKERWKPPGQTTSLCDRNSIGVDISSPAVGGDVVAVACCFETNRDRNLACTDDSTDIKTVVSAFEVVAYADCSVMGGESSRPTDGVDQGPRDISRTHASAARMEQTRTIDDIKSCTSLEPLSASTEMTGACFNLEPLDRCFVAMSLNDAVLVLGWSGKRSSLR